MAKLVAPYKRYEDAQLESDRLNAERRGKSELTKFLERRRLSNPHKRGRPRPPTECKNVELYFDRFYGDAVLLTPDERLFRFNSEANMFEPEGWIEIVNPTVVWSHFVRQSPRYQFQGEWK